MRFFEIQLPVKENTIDTTNSETFLVLIHRVSLFSTYFNNLLSQGEEMTLVSDQIMIKQEEQREPYWENLPDMLLKRSKFGSATHDNKIYVFGGVTCPGGKKLKTGTRTNKAEMFDCQTNSWIELPDMPSARSECSCAVVGDNIYIIGGLKNSEKSASYDGEVFNTKTTTWSDLPSMNYPQSKHQSVAAGDMIYVFGGYRGSDYTEAYDTVAREWTVKSRMNVHRYECASAVVNNKIFAMGGMREFCVGTNKNAPQYHRYLETMEEYDIKKDEWTLSKEKMRNRRAGCSATVVGSTIKIIGGYDEKGPVISIEAFNTIKREWNGCFIPPPKIPRKHFTAEIIGDHSLLVVGGVDDSDLFLNSLEKYTLPDDSSIKLRIPSINKLSNIKLNQEKCPDHLLPKRKKCHVAREDVVWQKYQKTQRKGRLGTKKRNVSTSFLYKNSKLAKDFDGEIFLGYVKSYDYHTEYWTVEYEDGDEEELDRMELEIAMKLHDEEEGKGKQKKMKKTNKKKTNIKENAVKTQTEARSVGPVDDGNSQGIVSLKQQIDSKIRSICALEEKVFGESLEGPLQNRVNKLKDFIHKVENEVFGENQTGNVEERLEKVNSFVRNI